MRTYRIAQLFPLLVAVAALVVVPYTASAEPMLHVGDEVFVAVYNHPELSGQHVVDSAGNIVIALAGAVPSAGLVPKAVAERIRRGLRRYLPYVAVEVQRQIEGSSITIAGWPFPVNDGIVKYLPGQTLAGAVVAIRTSAQSADASGRSSPPALDPYHSQIDMRSVRLERDGLSIGTYDMVALAAAGDPGPRLRPGDAILFRNKPIRVQVSGAVKQPGFAYLATDEPLSDAIDEVYGPTDVAMTAGIVLRRDGFAKTISIADPAFRDPARDGDILVVPTAPSVTVAGIVLHPGTVMLKSDVSLLAAVFSAGGPDKDGDLGHVRVVHGNTVKSYDVTAVARGDFAANPQLSDGDEVYVPHGKRIDNTILASLAATLRWALFP